MLAIKVGNDIDVTEQCVAQHLGQHVQGRAVPFSDAELAELHGLSRLRKVYKFELPKPGPQADGLMTTTSFVLGTMALKGS